MKSFLRFAIWLLSFSSIFCLLGFLYKIIPMQRSGMYILIPSLVCITVLWWYAYKKGHSDIHLAMKVGFWGGILGILGYDLIRLPLHFLGLNPLTPIRSYGMYLTNTQHSSLGSDLVGFLYHFSNGITFAWIYTLIALRRSRWWGVAWGIVLELFAYLTVFGVVYHLKGNPTPFLIGLGAHVFYGYPLGWLAEKPEERLKKILNSSKKIWLGGISLGIFVLISFFALAWESPLKSHSIQGQVRLGNDGIYQGWTRIQLENELLIENTTSNELQIEIPQMKFNEILAGEQVLPIQFPEPGIYQIRIPNTDWRSAFVSVEKNGYPIE